MSLKECKNNISSESSSLVLKLHSCPGLRLRIAENKLQKSGPTSPPRVGCLPAWLSREDANHGASAPTPPAPLLLGAVPGAEGLGGCSRAVQAGRLQPHGTGGRCVPSHPGTQASLRDEAKTFKASGNGDPPHKADGRWLQT